MKRLIIPIAVLLVCVTLITACGTSTPATSQPAATSAAPATTQTTTSSVPTTSAAPATSSAVAKPPLITATTPPVTTTTIAPASKYGGTLRMIQPVGPASPLSPPEASGEALREMQLSIETLLRGELDGTMSPSLVVSYNATIDPANASFTLSLRKGVKFQDGTDFNAKAAKWNLDQTKAGPANVGTTQYWKSIEIIDDYTIKINFTTWQNRLTTGLGMASTNQISPTAFEKNGLDWVRTHMVGTGPFSQTDYQRDVTIKTTKFKDYWDTGKPYLDGVQYLLVTDALTAMALFKSGGSETLDLGGNGRNANELKAAGYNIMYQQSGTNVLIPDSLNADSPWSNAKVRQAAEYAIDKVALNNAFGYGYNEVAYQLCSPSTNVYDKNFKGRTYDLAKAKQLLTEAGYPNGFKTRIISQGTANRDKMIAIQAMLLKVGIQASTEFPEALQFNAYTTGAAGWKNGLLYQYIFEWPNFNYGLNLWFSIPSLWFQSLKKPDGWKEALAASLATKEPDKAIIQKMVQTFYDDCTTITIDYPAQLTAVTGNVRDSGIYTRIQNYYWRPQEAWLAK